MEPAERSKKRVVHPWINAIVHFLLCFAVGALVALAPLAATGTSLAAATIRSSFFSPFGGDAHRAMAAPSPSPPAAPELGPLLIVVTVTQPDDNDGMAQDASVARLAHTLRHVAPPLLWIIVVGAGNRTATARTEQVLRGTGLLFRHLTYDATNFTGADAGDEANHQRNVALSHIERHRLNGVVHFASASGVYDLRFFQMLRQTRGISAWPVATISPAEQRVTLQGPTCNSSQITGWYSKDSNTNGTESISNSMYAADAIANKNSSSDHPIINISGIGFRSSLLWNSERSIIRTNASAGATQDFNQFVREIENLLVGSLDKGVPTECFESQIMLWQMGMPTFTLNTEQEKEIGQQHNPEEEEKEIGQQHNPEEEEKEIGQQHNPEEEEKDIGQQQNPEEEKEVEQQQNPEEGKEIEQQQNPEEEKEIKQQQTPKEEKEIEQQQNLMKSDEDPTT